MQMERSSWRQCSGTAKERHAHRVILGDTTLQHSLPSVRTRILYTSRNWNSYRGSSPRGGRSWRASAEMHVAGAGRQALAARLYARITVLHPCRSLSRRIQHPAAHKVPRVFRHSSTEQTNSPTTRTSWVAPEEWLDVCLTDLVAVDVGNLQVYRQLLQEALVLQPKLLFTDPRAAAESMAELESCLRYSCCNFQPMALGLLLVRYSPAALRAHLQELIGAWQATGSSHASRSSFGLLFLIRPELLLSWTPLALAKHLQDLASALPHVNVPLVLVESPIVAAVLMQPVPTGATTPRVLHRLPGYVIVSEHPGRLCCQLVRDSARTKWYELYLEQDGELTAPSSSSSSSSSSSGNGSIPPATATTTTTSSSSSSSSSSTGGGGDASSTGSRQAAVDSVAEDAVRLWQLQAQPFVVQELPVLPAKSLNPFADSSSNGSESDNDSEAAGRATPPFQPPMQPHPSQQQQQQQQQQQPAAPSRRVLVRLPMVSPPPGFDGPSRPSSSSSSSGGGAGMTRVRVVTLMKPVEEASLKA